MIPILYESTEKDFNHNGLGQMIEMIEATVTEQRNGEFEFYGEYPVSGRLYDSIDDFMFIKAKPNSVDEPHVFRIYEHELDINTQTVLLYATTKTNDLGSNMVIDVTINNETPLEALSKMKNNLIEPTDYMFYSDISTRSSTKWTRRNPLNCIAGEEGSLLQFWGGEIKRSNTVISLFSRRGKDNVTTIRHGKNLTGLTMNYSTKGMVTLIVPFFTHTPEGRDNEETIIGTHVKSQYINNYPLSYIKEVDYSQDDDVKDLATLNTKASKYFQLNTGIDVPTLSATVNIDDLSDSSEYAKFKNLENIELTDTITVYVKKYKVNITAKVNSLTYDVLADKNRELEIGSIRNTFFDDTVRQVKDLVREAEVTLINTIQLAANGKNKIFRGVDEPLTGMTLNDLWYKPVGSGEVEMYIFDGAYWQLEAYSGDAIKGTVNFANVNAINFNANSIVTGTLSGISITSPFDYVYSGTIRNVGTTAITQGDITMNGTFSNGSGGTYLKLNADGMYGENLTQTGAIRSLFKLNGDGVTVVKGGSTAYYRQDGVYFESGGNASIKYWAPNARIEIGSYNGVGLGVNSSGQFWNRLTVGGGQDGLDPFVDIWVDLTIRSTTNFSGQTLKNAAHIGGVKDILFADTSNRIVQGTDNILNIMSPAQINMGYTNGTITSTTMIITQNQIVANKVLNMNGNNITNQSDIRLKKNIVDAEVDGILLTEKQRFIEYEWDETNPYNAGKPEGIQFGLVAQYAGFLSVKDPESNYLSIDMNKQVNLNTLTNQQIIKRLKAAEEKIKQLESEK